MADWIQDQLDELLSTDEGRERYFCNSLIVDAAIELEEALKETGLAQKELADRLKKSESYVSQVLSGGKNISLKTLARFAFSLGFAFRLERVVLTDGRESQKRPDWDRTAVPKPPKMVKRTTEPPVKLWPVAA